MSQTSIKTKPAILAAGSCLLGHFLNAVRDLALGAEDFEYAVFPRSSGARALRLRPELLMRCRVLIEETSPWHRTVSPAERALLPSDCRIIRVPTIHFNSLWPLMCADPRNEPSLCFPAGMLPFSRGDRLALKIMETEADPQRGVRKYFETDLEAFVDLDRAHELETVNLFAREANCDIRLAAYVTEHFTTSRLFLMHHMAGRQVMTFALAQILSHPSIFEQKAFPLARAIQSVPRWLSQVAHAPAQSPVHPGVARHFGLTWYRDDMRFIWRASSFTFREWIEFYFRFRPGRAAPLPQLDVAS